jgi:hypothetical protein
LDLIIAENKIIWRLICDPFEIFTAITGLRIMLYKASIKSSIKDYTFRTQSCGYFIDLILSIYTNMPMVIFDKYSNYI